VRGAFSQVSVVFEQENPLSLAICDAPLDRPYFAPCRFMCALKKRGGGDRWPLIVVVERAIGLLFRSSLDRVLTCFHNGE
jgi:hypothetical protein